MNGFRTGLVILAFVCGLNSGATGQSYDCPLRDSDNGLWAGNYSVTVTDIQDPINGSLVLVNVAFATPETTGSTVSSGTIDVEVYCAEVVGAGCDGQDVSINTGINAIGSNSSYCLGCSGIVVPVVTGLGAYNESHFSTCDGCSCNQTSGHPLRDGKPSYGEWNITGNCSVDLGRGSGSCNCSQYDGTVITPLGPWVSSGNCSGCNCSVWGDVFTPPSFYNTSSPNYAYYPVYTNFGDPLCFLENCTCDENGTSLESSPLTYNITMLNESLFYPTIQVLDDVYCWLANCTCDVDGNSTGSYTTTWNVTKANASNYFTTIRVLDNTYCWIDNCSCDAYGNATGSYTTLYNVTMLNSSRYYKTIAVLDSYCSFDSCSCDANGTATGNYTTTYNVTGPNSTIYFSTWDSALANCSASNCSCDLSGSVGASSDAACGCTCTSCAAPAINCTCSGATSSTTGGVGAKASNNAEAVCGCGCVAWLHDCGCGCDSCSQNASCSCSGANSSTLPNTRFDESLATCGCQCDPWVQDCGCGCSSCDTEATCSCSHTGHSTTSPNSSFDSALATCGCQCDPWVHDCGCGCESCSKNATCDCTLDGNSSTLPNTPYDGSLATCGCQCDTWIHDCGCRCDSCNKNATCDCNATGDSTTFPAIATDYCGCGCVLHQCECGCQRDSCDCGCEKTCDCNCTRNDCGYDTPDTKNFSATGGYTCGVQANCYTTKTDSSHPGFFAGGLFSAYTGQITAHLLKYDMSTSVSTMFSQSYLSNYVQSAASSVFSSLAVTGAATYDNAYSLFFSAVGYTFLSNETALFTSVPQYYRVYQEGTTSQGLSSTTYLVENGLAELGNYTIIMYGSDGQPITNVTNLDGFNVSLMLVTGPSGDSSATANFAGSSYSKVDPADFHVFNKGTGIYAEAVDDVLELGNGDNQFHFGLAVSGHVGYSFQVVARISRVSGTQNVVLGTFRIDPAGMTVNFGAGYGSTFGQSLFPVVVRVNGEATNATDEDGLPGPMQVQFDDGRGGILSKAMCTNCVQVRLVQCDDSTGNRSYPTCASVSQAYCATDSDDGSMCNTSTSYLDTITGTTTANIVNGTAEFTDLQLSYVLGAGYRLQFTLNPGSARTTTAYSVSSPHTNGVVSVPDPSYSTPGVNNSFFIRPYELEVLQSPGGDGVDRDGDFVPDGAARGIPFRVQPAVVVKGDGYAFDKSWNNHGFAPITAVIASDACHGDCAMWGVVVTGNLTGVGTHALTYTASAGSLAAINYLSGTPSSAPIVQASYDTHLQQVGQLWRDMEVTTTDSSTAALGVTLEFRCGPNGLNESNSNLYTYVESASFDVFIGPDPPLNLKVFTYDTLGFRIEFDPAPIFPTKPLSGFIVEVDVCITGTNFSCDTVLNPYYDAAYKFHSTLGSEYSRGGGFTEEVFVTYGNVSADMPMDIRLDFTPTRSLYEQDSIVLHLNAPNVMFSNFSSACTLAGTDGERLTSTVDAATSTLTLTVKNGYGLNARDPIHITVPASCGALMPGGGGSLIGLYGNGTKFPLSELIVAPILGKITSTRFDNCKQGNTTTCVARKTIVLPTIQDSSSMDTKWSGQLRYGSTGSACLNAVPKNGSVGGDIFPSNRFCSLDTPNSNDPDSLDSFSSGNSGDNGAPIGGNPGRAGSGGSVSSGTMFPDSNADCRSGSASKNPCALTIGQEWTMGVNLSYTLDEDTGYYTEVALQWQRPRVLMPGDVVKIPLGGITFIQPCTDFPCTTFTEGEAGSGMNASDVNASSSSSSANCPSSLTVTELVTWCDNITSTNMTTNITTTTRNCTSLNVTTNVTEDSHCALLNTDAYLNWEQELNFTASIDIAGSFLKIFVHSPIPPMAFVYVEVSGFVGSATPATLIDEALAEVIRKEHMTVFVKDGAIKATYASSFGDPVGNYAQGVPGNPPTAPGVLSFTAGDVLQFRVYAYNGRFKSAPAVTKVQNRAIEAPVAPAYFTMTSMRSVGAKYFFSNLAVNQKSNPAGTKSTTSVAAVAGRASRIGIFFTPSFNVLGGQTITLDLPEFSGPGYLVMGDGTDIPIWDNEYLVEGNSSDCACSSVGTISTPSMTYRVTRSASGSAACNYTAPTGNTSTGNESIPWCACSDCECSLAGVVTTPAPLYNITGNSSDCDCTADGTPITPATTYNVSGNCSSCACDSSGVSSYTETYEGEWTTGCTNCTCSGVGNATGDSCAGCTCKAVACDCQCLPNIFSCQCPAFRECTCGCPVDEVFECGCYQNTTHPHITRAIWSDYTKSIVLTVDRDSVLQRGVAQELWIPADAGILYPTTGIVPEGPDGSPGGYGLINSYKLNWASAFPSPSQPREGFIVQMTTDLFWRTNVQTVVFPDILDRGVVRTRPLTHLTADVAATDSTISVANTYTFLEGELIMIDAEYIFVEQVNGTTLTVIRGVYKTSPVAHTIVTGAAAGSGSCSCDANSTSLGGGTCVCTQVMQAYIGATDPSISNMGIDTYLGYQLGTSCRIGGTFTEGCNPNGFNFKTFGVGTRTFQSGVIEGMVTPSVRWASACGGTVSTCTSGCVCTATTPVAGYEFGNNGQLPSASNVTIASIGDPFAFPLEYLTALSLATNTGLDSLSLAVASATGMAKKYIRINDEIIYVESITKGVLSASTYQSFGGSGCSCDFSGTPSGGSGCSCIGDSGTNCTSGGVLMATGGGGGKGFLADFNVTGGAVSSITVTSPGWFFTSTPTLYIASGGDGCVGVSLRATLSSNVVKVLRAQLGTTQTAHEASDTVSSVLWPSQRRASTPGERYNFRIAAYNAAGISPFVYNAMKLLEVFPRTLPAAGNVPMELVLTGGGTEAGNYTLYIGHLNSAGNVDLTRAKACTSLVVKDQLGTRMSCQSPSWVGARHSLILHFRSGSQEQIAIGNNWINFEAPTVQSVAPQQVDAGLPVNVTITGRNFGKDSAVVTGLMQGATPIPCTPMTVVSDIKAICTLIPKTGEQLNGDILMTVGNANTGGGQSTKRGTLTAIKEKPAPVQVEATVPVTIDAIPEGSPARTQVVASFTNDVSSALGVPQSRINVTGIRAGSVIITFVILPDPNSISAPSPAALAVNLATQAADPTSPLRQGTLTSQIVVSIPPGTAALAAAEVAATESSSSSDSDVPLWESSCVPKSYTAFDMEICYDCCTYVCEIGAQIPQVGGQNVLAGYRAQTCQGLCLVHCGYSRPITLGI